MATRAAVVSESRYGGQNPVLPLRMIAAQVVKTLSGYNLLEDRMGRVSTEAEIWPKVIKHPFRGRQALLTITVKGVPWMSIPGSIYRAIKKTHELLNHSYPYCTIKLAFFESERKEEDQ